MDANEFRKARILLAGITAFSGPPSHCPMCEQPFEFGDMVHRECLLKKHGGTLPDGFEQYAAVATETQ